MTSLPAGISSLRKLEPLQIEWCLVPSLPEELGALTRPTRHDLLAVPLEGAAALPGGAARADLSLLHLQVKVCRLLLLSPSPRSSESSGPESSSTSTPRAMRKMDDEGPPPPRVAVAPVADVLAPPRVQLSSPSRRPFSRRRSDCGGSTSRCTG